MNPKRRRLTNQHGYYHERKSNLSTDLNYQNMPIQTQPPFMPLLLQTSYYTQSSRPSYLERVKADSKLGDPTDFSPDL